MKELVSLRCDPTNLRKCSIRLTKGLEKGLWVQLSATEGPHEVIPHQLLPLGPGIIIASGGSYGGAQQCLLPRSHLDKSAKATGKWLLSQGLEPQSCLVLNPLPFHHVSGLMPWWRSRSWECKHQWLISSLIRNPIQLEKFCKSIFRKHTGPLLVSLVPTQLHRLINHPAGLSWLQAFDVIWIGGSALPAELAENARRKKIRLAPCYGATETTAMVTVLSPDAFLTGESGCGNPLEDVSLRINSNGALEVKTPRLAKAAWKDGHLKNINNKNGWWQSGDLAQLTLKNCLYHLEILGRLDTAIHSGGETIFPEQLETKLITVIKQHGLPIEKILLLPIHDKEWGQRLIALVKLEGPLTTVSQIEYIDYLKRIVRTWPPAERPLAWLQCSELTPNNLDKWERSKWEGWMKKNLSKNPINS